MQRQKKGIFDPHTRTKSIPIPTLKSSQFRPREQPDQFRPRTEIKSSPIPHTEIMSISTTHTIHQVIVDAYTKTKWFLARIQKQVNFDQHKNQVDQSPH